MSDSDADLFVAIHNNSIAECANPLKASGTRLFYYHPHGIALAESRGGKS